MRRTLAILLGALLAGSLTPATARQAEDDHSDNVRMIGSTPLPGATDVEFTKDGYAVMTVNGSGEDAGLWVVDVRDPENPKRVGHLPCAGSGYDVGLWRDIAVMSSDSAANNSSTEGGCN